MASIYFDSDYWVGFKTKSPICQLQISPLIGTMVVLSALWLMVLHQVRILYRESLVIH